MTSAIERAKRLLHFAKSVDDSALKDLEQVDDITDDKTKMPSSMEVNGGGASMGARGGEASPSVREHSTFAPQSGLAEQYASFGSARMGEMEKALNTLTGVVKGLVVALKADEPEDKKDEDEVAKAMAAIRKGRIALRKAEDEDEEDAEDEMEKAESHLKAAKAAIAKAYEGAEDDEKEAAAEKAHGAYKTLRANLAKAREAHVAKKAAAAAPVVAVAEAVKADEPVVETVKAADGSDITEMVKNMNQALVTQTKTVNDVMAMISGQSRAPAQPPAFAKATVDQTASARDRVEAAADDGLIEGNELLKARGILSRMQAVALGSLDASILAQEIDKAPPVVKNLFNQIAA